MIAMTMRAVSDGHGGVRHVPMPFRPKAKGKKATAKPVALLSFDKLRNLIEQIERLQEEYQGLSDDVKDTYSEAKANGFDPRSIRAIIALRRVDPTLREESERLLEAYREGLGL